MKKAAVIFAAALICAGSALSVHAAGSSRSDQFAPQGIYEIASAADPGFVLDLRSCTVKETEPDSYQLFRSLDVNQQKFYVERLTDVYVRISTLTSGKAVTADAGNGTLAVLAADLDREPDSGYLDTQAWVLKDAGDGTCYIQSRLGEYLTAAEKNTYNGTSVTLAAFRGDDTQKWILQETWISAEDSADTDLVNPYGEDGRLADLRIALKFGSDYEILTAEDFFAHTSETEDHQYVLDPEFLTDYAESLAAKYNTLGQPKAFTTSHGNTITLYEGSYGWELDAPQTAALIEETANTYIRKTLEPVWSHEGHSLDGNDGIGDSYVEIDLVNQKVWLYKDGEQLLETDCVTGTYGTSRQTPGGVYSIFYRQSPAVLNGPGYSSPVTYWMAFNGGIGLHDASWRSEFGGDIFRTNGSHGCVNLPLEAAKLIYEETEKGYPVVCYN